METLNTPVKTQDLPDIPDKRYFSIGEVGELCDVKGHELRYWEQEFAQLSPNKRRGNRRYYQRKDVELVRRIRYLLYEQGYTVHGTRLQLDAEQKGHAPLVQEHELPNKQAVIAETILELEELLDVLN